MDRELLCRIVRVEARFEATDRFAAGTQRGTGFRVGPGQVLTAQHVVERGHAEQAIERAGEIRVLLDEDGSGENVLNEAATVAWTGESVLDPGDPKALDAVLLEDELPGGDLDPYRKWVRVPLGDSGRWETDGFAAASRTAGQMGEEYLWGVCHPARELATCLKLTVEREPPRPDAAGKGATWAGVSGGPVLVKEGRYQGHLYGVVRSSPKRFPDALYAVGTPALLRDAELRRRLGIEEPAPPHASLVEKLRAVLEEDSRLAERLADLDDAWKARWNEGGCDQLVDVLCGEGRLKSVLERLRRLNREVDPSPASAERLRELAVVLVSILASRELPGGEHLDLASTRRPGGGQMEHLRPGGGQMEHLCPGGGQMERLRPGTASTNFAEALLASAYGTPCLFEKAEGPDLPRAWLRVPTTTMEAGMRAKSQVGEQLEELLLFVTESALDQPRFILPAQKALISTLPPGERRKLLRKLLRRNLTRLEERYGRPAYLVAGGELQNKMGAHLEVYLRRLANILPNLDLVVLETGAEHVERAIDQEDELWPLWEILDLLPDLRSNRP